jgi:membrane peptidoglycan carboxypeptidase
MQLIKNVYLRQHKTLARKIEEIMLVWLIERERAVSKNRMMEVYLNLIEWGPNVFGIGEASWFYFHKYPIQLSIGESVYLASLIPAPSKARWSIDSSGAASERWSRFTVLRNRFLAVDSLEFDREDFKVQLHPMAVERLRGPQKRQIDVIPEEIEDLN